MDSIDSTVKERLISFIKFKHLTRQQFEKSIGASNGYISSMRKSIGTNYIEAINKEYPELNREWLLYGEGEMLNVVADGGRLSKEKANFTLVPLINIDSVGGMLSHNAITPGEQYTETLIPFTEARDGDVAIHQTGDSMEPAIPAASILLIRRVDDWREYFGYGSVFVLWLRDGRRLTKQVLKYREDPSNFVTCHSFNPAYPDEELPRKLIREVWKVIKVLADNGW